MPAKNILKVYVEDGYYHVYNRGVEKRIIFLDEADYATFLQILKRHLSPVMHQDDRGNVYETYADRLELLAFCLMPNHFHLLFYLNNDVNAITELMRRALGAYTVYFNKKYGRVGRLFQGTYKATHILNEAYLLHISRYIHLNAKNYKEWPYSSWPYYARGWQADWVKPDRILDLFEGEDYKKFTADYIDHKKMLDEIKHDLANY